MASMREHFAAIDDEYARAATRGSRLAAALMAAMGQEPVRDPEVALALIGARSFTMDVRSFGDDAGYEFRYASPLSLAGSVQNFTSFAAPLSAAVRRLQEAAWGGFLFASGEDAGRMVTYAPPNLLEASGEPLRVQAPPRDAAGRGEPSITRAFGEGGNEAALPRVRVSFPLPDDPRAQLGVYVSSEACRHAAGGEAPYFSLAASLTHAGVSVWTPRDEAVAEEGLAIAKAVLAVCDLAASPRHLLEGLGRPVEG